MRGSIGAHKMHAHHDARKTTAKARTTFLQRFYCEVDPENVLAPGERDRRAHHARQAYFAKLALASAKSRRRKAAHDA